MWIAIAWYTFKTLRLCKFTTERNVTFSRITALTTMLQHLYCLDY